MDRRHPNILAQLIITGRDKIFFVCLVKKPRFKVNWHGWAKEVFFAWFGAGLILPKNAKTNELKGKIKRALLDKEKLTNCKVIKL